MRFGRGKQQNSSGEAGLGEAGDGGWWRWLGRLLWRHVRLALLLGILYQLVSSLVPVLQATAIGGAVRALSTGSPTWRGLLTWALLLFVSYLLTQSFLLMPLLEQLFRRSLQRTLDEAILRKVSGLDLAVLEQPAVRDLVARVSEPSERVYQMVQGLLFAAGSWLQILVLTLYLGPTTWWLGPLVLLVSALLVRLDAGLGRRFRLLDRELSLAEREAQYAARLLTGRASALEVRLFGLARFLTAEWERWFHHVHSARSRHGAGMVGRVAGVSLPRAVLTAAGVVALAWGLRSRGADPATFAAQLTAFLALLEAVGQVSWNLRELGEGAAFLDEVRQLLAMEGPKSRREIRGGWRPFPAPMRVGVQLEGVTFTYPGTRGPALRDVSMRLRPGERVALVGTNGAGKSTLAKLLLGLYEPDSGRITVDGIDVREIDPVQRRQAFSAVFQDFARFNLTAGEAIGLGQVDRLYDREAVRRAAREAGAADWIEGLPAGYDTPLGRLVEGGHEPSAGEWQRLAIARGLLREAQVLVLDEPAAALDPLAEAALYRHIAQLLRGRTALLISHRLGSARIADHIVVLDQGRIVEEGDHRALLAAGGLYARLFAEQAAWYREEVAS